MDFIGIILFISYFLNFVFIVFILFFEQTDSARRFSWLIAITFIPIGGIVLYMFFSGNFLLRYKRLEKSIRHTDEIFSAFERQLDADADSLIEKNDPYFNRHMPLLKLNKNYARSSLGFSGTVHVFTSGEETYKSLFAEIEKAKVSIYLSYFIIRNDKTGKKLISILARKAREGVDVRLLYDHIGSFFTSGALFIPLKKAGGEVHKFFPVTIIAPYALNYRNHRKIVVIDHSTGYFGGINIGDEYANCSPKQRFLWRDTHIRVTNSAAVLLEKSFLSDWYSSKYKTKQEIKPEPPGSNPCGLRTENIPLPPVSCTAVPMQIVTSGPNDIKNDEIRDALIFMISTAKKSVHIETPYFTPDPAFFSILKIAALSGLDVKIIVPRDWDKFYVKLAAMPYISELTKNGIKFYHYKGFIHSKMFVIDGEISTIGSTNIDTRSFSLHFELNAFFYSKEFGKISEEIFIRDLENSIPAAPDAFRKTPVLKKALCNFFRLFAPLM